MNSLLLRLNSLVLMAWFFLILIALPAFAEQKNVAVFYNLSENIVTTFSGYRLGLQLGAVAATPALSLSSADAAVFRGGQTRKYNAWANPAVYIGVGLAPLVSGGLYLTSRLTHDNDFFYASFAATQASLLALTYSAVLKTFTGRPHPGQYSNLNPEEQSRTFHWGLGREGIISGWPSGHTIVTTAMATSIASYYNIPPLWAAAAGTTAYMIFGMSLARNGTEHWFSDTIAGALMGYTIGSSVGESFYRLKQDNPDAKPKPTLLPVSDGSSFGIRYSLFLE